MCPRQRLPFRAVRRSISWLLVVQSQERGDATPAWTSARECSPNGRCAFVPTLASRRPDSRRDGWEHGCGCELYLPRLVAEWPEVHAFAACLRVA